VAPLQPRTAVEQAHQPLLAKQLAPRAPHTPLQPPLQPRTVVEEARVPHPVVAAWARVEVHAVGAVKHVDAVHGVLGRVAAWTCGCVVVWSYGCVVVCFCGALCGGRQG